MIEAILFGILIFGFSCFGGLAFFYWIKLHNAETCIHILKVRLSRESVAHIYPNEGAGLLEITKVLEYATTEEGSIDSVISRHAIAQVKAVNELQTMYLDQTPIMFKGQKYLIVNLTAPSDYGHIGSEVVYKITLEGIM